MYAFNESHDLTVRAEKRECKTHLTEDQIRSLVGKRIQLLNTVVIADDSAEDGVTEQVLKSEYVVAAFSKNVMFESDGTEVVTWTIYGDDGQGQKLQEYLKIKVLDD